jgi:hypothetical protein
MARSPTSGVPLADAEERGETSGREVKPGEGLVELGVLMLSAARHRGARLDGDRHWHAPDLSMGSGRGRSRAHGAIA